MDTLIREVNYKGHIIQLHQDTDPLNPFENDEGLGDFFHWKDYGTEQYLKYCELLGYDPDTKEKIGKEHPDAVLIDKYEHTQVFYSIHGEGMQCRWDTSSGWAVWYPNSCLKEELKGLSKAKRRKKCIEFARQACEVFNQWANGEVYGYIILDKQGENIESHWGFIGDPDKDGLFFDAKSTIDSYIKDNMKKHVQKLKAQIKNKVLLDKREAVTV